MAELPLTQNEDPRSFYDATPDILASRQQPWEVVRKRLNQRVSQSFPLGHTGAEHIMFMLMVLNGTC
ncbi:hypothetical protein ALQ78_101317 [Pseudomonas syringae pv. aptata]|nr:hypothetical protein ALO65_101817 [Pseudomonas syringae pv. papulans]RMM41574.1 hypothetical protein ALQ78_101317 [Pseudomonas syringae pv. aptata]RMS61818.1 hypothetical protein ALP63_102137 [Pseudomonas syringae pv. aceris]RMN46900.1 hypothetical protein ALQ60_101687 [Pseudomonas syringae pv. papulans]RMN82729.1 hypothetical protein ALQ56_102404 [Pseudomonas syringae pv. papulans]